MDTQLRSAIEDRIADLRVRALSALASREANEAAAEGALRQRDAALAVAEQSGALALSLEAEANAMQASLDGLIAALVDHGLAEPDVEPPAPAPEDEQSPPDAVDTEPAEASA